MTDGPGSGHRLPARRAAAGTAAFALAAVLAPAIAHAQTAPAAQAEAVEPDEGLGARGFYLETDLLIRDDDKGIVTARGGVEARYRGRTLRAEEVVYDTNTGVVTARGKVQIVDLDGSATFAEEVVLDQELTAGIAKGFSARLAGDAKDARIAAAVAVRRSETVTELTKAIYTPCPICAEDGTAKEPTWSIRAEHVTQDRSKQVIYYQNAVIEMFGVPIFYTPVFWHPDPQAPRSSGLLPPKIAISKRRGLSYEQPYLQVLSPSSDLVISPQVNTKVNPFLNLGYRKRFYSGQLNVRAGYTYEADLTSDGDRIGDRTSRSYLLADGRFDITDKWKWGFTAERASDDLIFDKYDVGDAYEQRGLVPSDDHRLISQVYSTRQDQRSYLSISAISVQGLRPADNDRTFPTIAPLIEGRWEPEAPVLGGRLRVLGSGVVLTRNQSPVNPLLPGTDSRRATLQADWRKTVTFSAGLRVSAFGDVRADAYSVDDLAVPPASSKSATVTRGLGVFGLDFSLPLYRRDGDRTVILEPLVQLAVSPDSDPDPRVPNEDSTTFEFDETNLFRADKFPGFDLYEGGRRLNVGGRATVFWDDGRNASLLIGRSYRSKPDPMFPTRSGLQRRQSDWVVAAEATPIKGVTAFTRARFEGSSTALRRIEAGTNISLERVQGYVRYLRDNEDPTGIKRQDIDFAGQVMVTKRWGFTVYGVRDLQADVWRKRDIGIVYLDDCLRMEVLYEHSETFNRTLGPNDSIILRLTLATLGDTGYSDARYGE